MCWEWLPAQLNPQLHFEHYGTTHGLPSPEVHCILEDSRGYMWFGTDNGASRFDGYRFENFGRQEGLVNPVVFELFEDDRGRVWMSTMSGNVYIWDEGQIRPWSYNPLIRKFADRVTKGALQYLAADQTAYFVFSNYGFVVVDSTGQVDTITSNKLETTLVAEVPDGSCALYTRIYQSDKIRSYEAILAGERRKTWDLELITESGKYFLHLPKFEPATGPGQAVCLDGPLLFFGIGGVFYLQEDELKLAVAYPHWVTDVQRGQDSALWISLDKGEGVRRYSTVQDLAEGGEYQQYLNGESVSCTIEDRQGGRWVATLTNGVFYAKNPEMRLYNTEAGLPMNHTKSVAFKNDSVLFVSLDDDSIVRLDERGDAVERLIPNPVKQANNSLYYDTARQALYSQFFVLEDGHWESPWQVLGDGGRRPYHGLSQQIAFVTPDSIYASGSSGIEAYDKKSKRICFLTAETQTKRTYDVLIDARERMWIGTNRGLQQFTDRYLPPPHPHPVFHTRVEAIEQLSDSTIVFGTKGSGVAFWKDDRIQQLTTHEGLTADMIENIYVDECGVIWVGTLAGLNKLTRREDGMIDIRQYNVATGLPSNEIHEVAANNGQLWLCTPVGLVKFWEHEEVTQVPPPRLTGVRTGTALYTAALPEKFAYAQRDLSIEWLAINYRQRGRIPYRYRFARREGWNYTYNRTANYPALSPGRYTFEVQAQNEDRYWSPSAVYTFQIRPPWWMNFWFRLFVLLGIGGGVYYLYHRRLARIESEAALQREVMRLEKSALQAQMNPHFIFNCLNSIQNFILQNDKRNAVTYLSRFARLVRHTLNASIRGKISLEEEIDLLDSYLLLERERFGQAFAYRIETAEELPVEAILIPPLLLQPYVENAVIHGLADSGIDGFITLNFEEVTGYLVVKITDNGRGYDIENHKGKNTRYKSVGMSVTSARLQLLSDEGGGGTHTCTISSAPNQGTEVIVRLKIERNDPTTQRPHYR